MSNSPNPRKRPAPGASPALPMQQRQQSYAPTSSDQLLRWNGGGGDGSGYVDASPRNVNSYGMMAAPSSQFATSLPPTSNALARRQAHHALVPTGPRPKFDATPDQWPGLVDDGSLPQQSRGPGDEHDSIEMLEERAQRAKREAQARRKQIPPFVQKLSSFLDKSENTDLIRWSDKGDSFIVLDEDEFARTLIPELFKHNNYASFVRQLNMYGFHKRVGLSDNSMKASERKNKSPSEYYNPYFKRGHPTLLWLINKPKSGTSKKKGKKGEDEADSDDDGVVDDSFIPSLGPPTGQPGRPQAPVEAGPLQKRELAVVRDQLTQLQSQQKTISDHIRRLRQDHAQLYQQAALFQNMHSRHENSINAILNFLANVFRKSLEEQGGAQNVGDILASMVQSQMPQGSVVDLGDFFQQQAPDTAAVSPPKRPQRLLPPVPVAGHARATAASSPAPIGTPSPHPRTGQAGQSGQVTELFDSPSDSTSPSFLQNELQSNPQEGMMKIIQDANAGSTSGLGLPDVVANTPNTLSNDQRNKMLSILAGQKSTSPRPAQSMPPASPNAPANSHPGSLSPLMPSIPPPSLNDLDLTQSDIDALQRLQEDQNSKLDELANFLGPISPSGRIPGVSEHSQGSNYFSDNVDIDQFLDSGAFGDTGGGGDFTSGDFVNGGDFADGGDFSNGEDFNFMLDGGSGYTPAGGNGGFEGGRVIETNSPANNTPSPAGTEEITRNDLDHGDSPERGSKRRRKG